MLISCQQPQPFCSASCFDRKWKYSDLEKVALNYQTISVAIGFWGEGQNIFFKGPKKGPKKRPNWKILGYIQKGPKNRWKGPKLWEKGPNYAKAQRPKVQGPKRVKKAQKWVIWARKATVQTIPTMLSSIECLQNWKRGVSRVWIWLVQIVFCK